MRGPSALVALAACIVYLIYGNGVLSSENQGEGSNTVPAFPTPQQKKTCRLDLSAGLFGGVREACGQGEPLERSRCCPVLAAWLYAAHARETLEPPPPPSSSPDLPVPPEDSQTCVSTLETSLKARGIDIPRPNSSCDAFLCFCNIRLHQLASLDCPAAFRNRNSSEPTAAVRALKADCTDPSYQGCSTCLNTLEKVKEAGDGGGSERRRRMYGRDCEIMGLTWLLAANKTAYIPTVSAVLRAIMYSDHPLPRSHCSPDQDNMPLAVDSAELDQSSAATRLRGFVLPLYFGGLPLIPLLFGRRF